MPNVGMFLESNSRYKQRVTADTSMYRPSQNLMTEYEDRPQRVFSVKDAPCYSGSLLLSDSFYAKVASPDFQANSSEENSGFTFCSCIVRFSYSSAREEW